MLTTAHMASGAVAGTKLHSRLVAVGVGILLHYVGDRIPHQDVHSTRFELITGIGALLALSTAYGALSPVTICAAAASAPDLEHVVPAPRFRGRKLFPTHRGFQAWSGGIPVWAQLLLAGALLGALAGGRRATTPATDDGEMTDIDAD